MNKLLLTISFMLNIILIGLLLYVGGNLLNKNLENGDKKQAVYRIAVMQPAIHPSMDEITQGFIETLEKNLLGQCDCAVFNANNNVMLMRAQAEEIVQQKFDALMTIGTKATQLAKEVAQKKKSNMPIIFTAVADAVEKGIIKSIEASGNQLTGVLEEINFQEEVDLLLSVKPATKNVLLVYNPSQIGLVKEGNMFEKVFASRGVSLSRAEVFHSNEVYQKISILLANIDVVLILKDHTTVAALDVLTKLCSKNHITLLTNDLDSPARGAALGFGVFERQFGVQGALCAIKILVDRVLPTHIPCAAAQGNKLRINPNACKTQGVDFSDAQIKLFKAIDVV